MSINWKAITKEDLIKSINEIDRNNAIDRFNYYYMCDPIIKDEKYDKLGRTKRRTKTKR